MKKYDGPAQNAENLFVFIPGIAILLAERKYKKPGDLSL